MDITLKYLASLALAALILPTLGGCSCGFDCNNDRDNGKPSLLSLGFSDEALEELKQVVIEVDRITLRRTGAEDVVIDTFTIEELDLVDTESFQMDLLDYRGLNQLLIVENLELTAASYSQLSISILGGDVNRSYVQESDDSLKPIIVSGGVLTLPGPTLTSGDQLFTVEFGLAQALQFQQTADNYLLTSTGVRVMDNATSASLSGRVDNTLFDTVEPCSTKTDPEAGNRIYLYSESGLSLDGPADVFTSASANPVPAGKRAPYAVASMAEDVLTGSWQYSFGYIAAGDYTLAFSCNAADDDPVNYDDLTIPLPEDQLYDIQLSEAEQGICDLAQEALCQ